MYKKILSKHIRYFASFIMVVAFVAIPFFAFGQQTDFGTDYLTGVGLGSQDIRVTIVKLLRIAFGILGTITLVLIVYAGFIWMTSSGKQDVIAKAKKIIINAVIGLIIIILAAAITEFVFSKIQEATTPVDSGNACAPANSCVSGCTFCNASGVRVFDTTCGECGLGSNQFELRDVQTAHGGTDAKQDVYLCSQVQPEFNNTVDPATLNGNAKVTDISGVEVSGTWIASGNVLNFSPDNNFAPNRDYEVRLTSALADASGDFLAGCNGTTCESSPPIFPYYGWQFKTGVDTDTVAPTITKAYPKLDGTSRTVSRSPVIDVTYSEAINFLSIADTDNPPNPQISKFVLQALDGPGGNPVGQPIDNVDLTITSKSNGFRVKIDSDSSLLLDSFTWYRITVQDVTDLCANNQQPSPEIWEFQTNDSVPGVVSKSPTGANSCPSETILFTFGTAMYDELIVLDIDGQFITLQPTEFNLSTTVAGFGTLKVLDPSYSPEPVNGNYRNYEFIPENPWQTDTTYSVTVTAPNLVVDNDGNTLYENWQFSVGEAGSCTCSPYITKLSPNQGVVGQCATVYGRCFSGATDNPGSLSAIRFIDPFDNATGAVIKGQDATFVTTDVPLSLGPDTYNVEVDLAYNDSNYGTLTSNRRQFVVEAGDAYTGPCLTLIDPSRACYGKTITLEGSDFGADPGEPNRDTAINNVNFSASGNIPDTAGSSAFKIWSDAKTEFVLPNGFLTSDVTLTADGLTSNALPFELSCRESGDENSNQFLLKNYWPGCDSSCPNAGIGANFSKEIDASTVTNTSISVYRCSDGATCAQLVNVPKTWEITNNNKDLDINAGTLNDDAYYRVVIRDSVSDTIGIPLTNLNYDEDIDGIDDSYSWTFKTKTGGCTPTSVDVVPNNMSFGAVGDTQSIYGRVLSDQGCYGNQPLIASDYDWFWTQDNAAIINVTYNDKDGDGKTDPDQNVTSQGVGSADAIGRLNKTSLEDRTPVVVSLDFAIKYHWPSCNAACMNSEIGAEFYSDIEASSVVDGSISLLECTDGASCAVFANPTPTFDTTVTTRQIILQPISNLKPATYYRVVFRDVLRGVNGQNLTGLNYDEDIDGIDDSYSWTFKTDDIICDITGVTTQPGSMIFSNISQSQDIVGKAVSNQGCNGGQFIDAWDYNWTWGVNDVSVATLQSPLADVNNDTKIDPVQLITSQAVGITTVSGSAGGFSSISDIEVLDNSGLPVSCDGDTSSPSCEPNSNKCASTDFCNPNSCSCEPAPAPNILSIEPIDGSTLECRNSSFKIVFDQLMNSSEGSNYIELIDTGSSAIIDTSLSSYEVATGAEGCAWEDGCTVFVVSPTNLLPESSSVELSVRAGMPSIYDQGLVSDSVNSYTIGNSICQLDGVDISPASWMFTSLLFPDSSHDFIARGYTNQGGSRTYIVPTSDYDWNWTWTRDDPDQFITTSENIDTNTVTVIKSGIGNAYITAEATIVTDNVFGGDELGNTESGTASIDVFICDFPWPSPPPYDIGWNATMKYCRGNIGDDLLPIITETANFPVSGTLLRDTIFTVDESDGLTGKDVIGLRVYDNPTHASAAGWYASQDFQQGSPSETVIDGYPAVVDGRTIYIHFTDVEKSNPDKIRSYILVLSHNQNESSDTRAIYSQLIKNLLFNGNIISTEKKSIQQDMIRMGGLGFIAEKLLAYQADNAGALPDLSSGSFVTGMSTSRWPQSWQSILGNALGTKMPLDPDNDFAFCPDDYDQQSCFNNNLNPQFYCADGSHIYIYKDGSIYANPKYKNVEWVGIGTVTGDTCASFGLSTVGGTISQASPLELGALPPEVTITSPNDSASGDQNVVMQYNTTQAGDVTFYANNTVYGSASVGIGAHSFTYTDLPTGNNNLRVEINNIYGSGSDSIDYTVEFVTPPDSVAINSPSEGDVGGVDVTVNYTLKGSGTIVCKVDTGEQFTIKNVETGTYSCPTFSNLAEGNRTFTVTYTPSGPGSSISDSVHYTATTDVVTIDNPASGTVGGSSVTVTYTMNAGSAVQCRDDTGVVYTTGNGPGTYTCTLNNLPLGNRTITVEMLDSGVSDSILYTVESAGNNVVTNSIINLAKMVGSVLRNLFNV